MGALGATLSFRFRADRNITDRNVETDCNRAAEIYMKNKSVNNSGVSLKLQRWHSRKLVQILRGLGCWFIGMPAFCS